MIEKLEIVPGLCPFCDAPVVQRRAKRRVFCGSKECRRIYHQIYRITLTERWRALGLNAHGKPYKRMGRPVGIIESKPRNYYKETV